MEWYTERRLLLLYSYTIRPMTWIDYVLNGIAFLASTIFGGMVSGAIFLQIGGLADGWIELILGSGGALVILWYMFQHFKKKSEEERKKADLLQKQIDEMRKARIIELEEELRKQKEGKK